MVSTESRSPYIASSGIVCMLVGYRRSGVLLLADEMVMDFPVSLQCHCTTKAFRTSFL